MLLSSIEEEALADASARTHAEIAPSDLTRFASSSSRSPDQISWLRIILRPRLPVLPVAKQWLLRSSSPLQSRGGGRFEQAVGVLPTSPSLRFPEIRRANSGFRTLRKSDREDSTNQTVQSPPNGFDGLSDDAGSNFATGVKT